MLLCLSIDFDLCMTFLFEVSEEFTASATWLSSCNPSSALQTFSVSAFNAISISRCQILRFHFSSQILLLMKHHLPTF